MTDTFTFGDSVVSPANSAFAVTPSDSADLATTAKALYVWTGGDVVVDMRVDGSTITFANVQAGAILPVRAKRVRSTGTTADDIVALY